MIRVTKSDGTTSSYPASAAIVTLDEHKVPQHVRLQNGEAEEEWPARDIANLDKTGDLPFRLEIQRHQSHVAAADLMSEVSQLHFNHDARHMTALHAEQIVYELRW